MASVFGDAKEILLNGHLEKSRTINFEYFGDLLDQLKEKIRDNRPGFIQIKQQPIKVL